jgi:TraR antiactivator
MAFDNSDAEERIELRPLVSLTRGLTLADLETITIDAIRTHRCLVDKAQSLFEALPDNCGTADASGGMQHLAYIKAAIDMHAQMSAVTTLVQLLGYMPNVHNN